MNVKKVACWDEGLRRVLEGQRVENPYALIDALTYGFEGDNVACWEVFDESRLEAVVYRYYDGLQVVFCGQAGHRAIRAVATLVEKMDPSMVQTSYSAAAELATVLADYSLSEGWVMRADGTQVPDPAAVRATEADYPEIARLICGDEEIGKHYDVSALVAQLCERERLQGCRSIVLGIAKELLRIWRPMPSPTMLPSAPGSRHALVRRRVSGRGCSHRWPSKWPRAASYLCCTAT